MALTPQSGKPKWADPNAPWKDDDAPPLMDMMRSEADIDRFHNREDQSPEAMAEAISEMQSTIDGLGGRLAAVEEGAAGVIHAARDLGASMVKMGDALTKRVKELEDGAAWATENAGKAAEAAARAADDAAQARAALAAERGARQKMVKLTVAGGVVLAAAIVGLTFFGPKAAHTGAPAPVLYSPSTPAN
jgi:hypothetical protein